uniref:HDC06636 n=1 Tax=Drosophila melanogaster TaxID=7227 RepID=Q6IGC1_DROME|nr:TPA_inf: HDC06636 [Drosophila melanogaster]
MADAKGGERESSSAPAKKGIHRGPSSFVRFLASTPLPPSAAPAPSATTGPDSPLSDASSHIPSTSPAKVLK